MSIRRIAFISIVCLTLVIPLSIIPIARHYGWTFKSPLELLTLITGLIAAWAATLWYSTDWIRGLLRKAKTNNTGESYPAVTTQEFPFKAYSPKNLASKITNLYRADIPYVPRLVDSEYVQMRKNLIEAQHLFILGRTGLGKTREAVELIKEIEAESGEEFSVLVPDGALDAPLIIPRDKLHRNVILFIDDLPARYAEPYRIEDLSNPKVIADDFRQRLEQTMRLFESAYGSKFRIIATGLGEPESRERLQLTGKFWEQFKIYELPDLCPERRLDFLNTLETIERIEITPEAKSILAGRSDGTYGGLIVPIIKERAKKRITEADAKNYQCIYPQDWELRVYKTVFEKNIYRKNLLAALSIVRQARITPLELLVVDLAARLCSKELLFWHRSKIRKELRRLTDWVEVSNGNLFCPDAYLKDKGELLEFKPQLLLSLRYIAKKAKYSEFLRASLHTLINYLQRQDDHWAALEVSKWGIEIAPDSPLMWVQQAKTYYLLGELSAAEKSCLQSLHLNDHENAWYLLGDIYAAQNKLRKSIGATRNAIKKDDTRPVFWLRLATTLSRVRELEEATEAAMKAIALDSSNPLAYVCLGICYDLAKQYEQAIETIKRAADIDPSNAIVWQTLGVTYSKSKRFEEAITACEKAIELDPNSVDAWIIMARIHEDQKCYDQAIIEFQRAISLDNQNPNSWLGYGITLDRAGYKEQAFNALKQATSINSELKQAWVSLCFVAQELDLIDEAINAASYATKLEPKDAKNWQTLAITYSNVKRYDDGVDAVKKAIHLDPNSAESWHILGTLYSKTKKLDEALKCFTKASTLNPTMLSVWQSLSEVYTDLDNEELAFEVAQKAAELMPEIPGAWKLLGSVSNRKGLTGLSLKAAQKIVELEPNSANSWYLLGINYRKAGQRDKAIEALRKAVEINPNKTVAWESLGALFSEIGRPDLVLTVDLKLTQLEPDNALRWHYLGAIYFKLEDYQKAKDALNRATQLDPNMVVAWQLLIELNNKENPVESNLNAALKLTELEPENPSSWYRLGISYLKNGEMEKSVGAFQKAINKAPDKSWITQYVYSTTLSAAISLRDSKEYEKAIYLCNFLISLNPNNTEAWQWLSSSLRRAGRHEEALPPARRIVEINPKDAQAWYVLGLRLDALGKTKEAIDALQRSFSLNKSHGSTGLQLSKFLIKDGQNDEALKLLKILIQFQSQNKDVWEAYGKALLKAQQYTEAEKAFDRLALLVPKTVKWKIKLGYLYRASFNLLKAVSAFEEALLKDDKAVDALYGLALCKESQGQTQEALRLYELVYALDPSHSNISGKLIHPELGG